MQKDPLEMHDIAGQQPEVVARMRKGYEAWFKDVSSTRGYAPPRIHLGAPQENPSTLTRQDWRGPRAGWGPMDVGYWEVQVSRAGSYEITLRFAALRGPGTVSFSLGSVTEKKALPADATEYTFRSVRLSAGPGRLEASVTQDKETVGVLYVDVKKID
jgi:hypothetical protein